MMAGGGLGSLFGEDEDKRQPHEIPGNYQAHMDELSNRVRDYTKLLREGKISQAEFNQEAYKMAPLAAGAGDYLAGYGGIIGGTLEKLKGMTAGTQEYVDVVNNELNPAWVISKGLADDMANGMSELDARKKALSNSIDALAASSGLDGEQQRQLIDLIISQSGSVAELTEKYNRYNEIKQQLMNAHTMERSQVEALAAELRGLHDELGIQEEPMTAVVNTMGDLNVSMKEMVATLKELAGLPKDYTFNVAYNQTGTSISNPGTAHGGRLITRHGGGDVPIYAHAGYNPAWPAPRPGEVDIRALVGEWVIQPAAVDYYGNDFMAAINAMRVPVVKGAAAAAAPRAAKAAPVFNLSISFAGAVFGSDPEEAVRALERRLPAILADMAERGEQPGNSDSMAVSW
jgi:chaperonin cofactor prefoldin